MNLKKTTEKSSDQLRGIATGVLIVGLILGGVLVFVGLKGMLGGSSQNYRYSTIWGMLFSSTGFGSLLIGLIIMFWHYVLYVMISAYATIVENSDRSDVVDALFAINDSLNHSESDRAYQEMMDIIDANRKKREYDRYDQEEPSEDIVNKAVEEVRKAQIDDEDIELEKIDISDISIEK